MMNWANQDGERQPDWKSLAIHQLTGLLVAWTHEEAQEY
jgi:hypothetical protein